MYMSKDDVAQHFSYATDVDRISLSKLISFETKISLSKSGSTDGTIFNSYSLLAANRPQKRQIAPKSELEIETNAQPMGKRGKKRSLEN